MIWSCTVEFQRGGEESRREHLKSKGFMYNRKLLFSRLEDILQDTGFQSNFHVAMKRRVIRQILSLLKNQVLCVQEMLRAKVCPWMTCSFFCTLSSNLFWPSSATLHTVKLTLPCQSFLHFQSGETWRAEFFFSPKSPYASLCKVSFPSSQCEHGYNISSFIFT